MPREGASPSLLGLAASSSRSRRSRRAQFPLRQLLRVVARQSLSHGFAVMDGLISAAATTVCVTGGIHMAKNNIRSIRFSDDIADMIDRQAGSTFTEKFERLVTRAFWELSAAEKELVVSNT